jgi:hypothetical protein
MPSAPSARLGLTAPVTGESPDGPSQIAALIAQLEASVGMARISEQVSAGGAGAGLTFAAIPAIWRHLRVVGVGRSNDPIPAATDNFRARFNSSSAAVYDSRNWRQTYSSTGGSDGAGIITAGTAGGTYADLSWIVNEGTAGDLPGTVMGFTLEVLDYTNAAWKTWLYRSVRASALGSGIGAEVVEAAGVWRSTAAITDLSLFVQSAGLDALSRATLYGLR